KTVNLTRIGSLTAVALAGALVLSSCAANEPSAPTGDDTPSGLTGTLIGGGASSQASAQDAWIAEFQNANNGVTIEYEPTGSGTGRDNFIAGANAYTGSDRAYKLDELADNTF